MSVLDSQLFTIIPNVSKNRAMYKNLYLKKAKNGEACIKKKLSTWQPYVLSICWNETKK